MNDKLLINEIFGSIDGEGLRTGELATFIRLTGCNLRCRYCDTSYAFSEGKILTIKEILDKVSEIGYRNITITGGEPLINPNVYKLINELISKGYKINIETNGAIAIDKLLNTNVLITMDYKTKSSGMNDKMLKDNLLKLRENDVLKIVCNHNDFDDIIKLLEQNKIKSYIYLSPIYNELKPSELVNFLKRIHNKGINTDKVRIQVQLHKIIWSPNKRGV